MNIGTLTATIGGDITPLKGALGQANAALNKFSGDVSKSATEVSSKLTKIGTGLSNVGKNMSMFLTLPLLGAAAAAGKMAMSWEEGMAKINTTAQLPKEGLKALSDQIYKLGAEAGADLSTVPEAYEKIISQTGDAALSTEIFAAALKGAKAGFTDVSVVSEALAQSLSSIGGGAASAQEVIDTLFAAKRVGAGEFSDFANYIPSLIASAKGIGVSWKEVAGSFAYMTGKGNDAASSTMLLQNAFNALGKSDITNGLKSAGIAVFDSTGKMRGLSDIFTEVGDKMNGMSDESKSAWLESIGLKDQQAKQAFMILSSETDKLRVAMDATANATGELETALAMAKNPAQNMAQVMTNLKGIAIGFGLIMLPTINKMISGLSNLLGWFVGLDETTKKWIVGIGAVVAGIGPLLLGIGSIMSLIPKLKTGFTGLKIAMEFLKNNPFILIATAVIGLGILIMKLWKNCDTFRAVVKYVAQSVAAYFQRTWLEIQRDAELLWLAIKTYFTAIPKLAEAVWNIVKRVMKGEKIGDVIKDEFGKAFSEVTDEAKGIKDKYNKRLKEIKVPNWKDILASEKAKGAAKDAGEDIAESVKDGVAEGLTDAAAANTPTVPTGPTGINALEAQLAKLQAKTGSFGVGEAGAKAEAANLDKIAAKVKEIEDAWKKVRDAQNESIGINVADAVVSDLEPGVAKIKEISSIIPDIGKELKVKGMGIADTVGLEVDKLNANAAKLKASAEKMKTEVGSVFVDFGEIVKGSLGSAFESFGENLGGMLAGTSNAGDLFKGLLKTVLEFCSSLGKALIAAGLGALSFQKLLASPWLAIGAGTALIALSATVSSLLDKGTTEGTGAINTGGASSVPAYASGALAISPHMAMVGDNPNARFDPEVILPASKLNQYLNTGNQGSSIPEVVYLRVRGEDLEATLDYRNKRNGNLR